MNKLVTEVPGTSVFLLTLACFTPYGKGHTMKTFLFIYSPESNLLINVHILLFIFDGVDFIFLLSVYVYGWYPSLSDTFVCW